MALATDGFIFDLGVISVDETLTENPLFDTEPMVEINGDVLLQYEWNRTGITGSDPNGSLNKYSGVNDISGLQGDWFNCFLFNTDSTDISDVNSEDIEYHTVKANWCGHSITRANYQRWQKPGGVIGDADNSGANTASGLKGTVQFNRASASASNDGNFNAAATSEITGYDDGTGVDAIVDATTHLNLAGEYMRYYSAKMFGGRLRYGLDIFSNEYALMEEVRSKDMSLNTQVLDHLTISNTRGIDTVNDRHHNTNIPHVLLSQLLADPQGALRVQNTLSKPAFSPVGSDAEDAIAGNGKAPSRTVQVEAVTGTVQLDASIGAGQAPAGCNEWYRVPLKAGDKLRIKVVMKENRTEIPATLDGDKGDRTYIIEYLLVD